MISYPYLCSEFSKVFLFHFTHITYDAVNLSPVCFKECYLDMNFDELKINHERKGFVNILIDKKKKKKKK